MRRLRRLAADARGTTVVEFAVVAPVMLLIMMGFGELAYQTYIQAVLTGAVQKAGRDATIQGNSTSDATSALDTVVKKAVQTVNGSITFTSSRKNYSQFANIGPEYFYDTNGNGVYDKSVDCFIDVNGNGVWDADPGTSGQGGASDVTLYTASITYPRVFPVAKLLGWGTATLSATTILKNQPYASQAAYTATKICPK